jgi:hypothetical protein
MPSKIGSYDNIAVVDPEQITTGNDASEQGNANNWYDNFPGVSKNYRYVFACERKREYANSEWGQFSDPKLYARYAKDGEDGESGSSYSIVADPEMITVNESNDDFTKQITLSLIKNEETVSGAILKYKIDNGDESVYKDGIDLAEAPIRHIEVYAYLPEDAGTIVATKTIPVIKTGGTQIKGDPGPVLYSGGVIDDDTCTEFKGDLNKAMYGYYEGLIAAGSETDYSGYYIAYGEPNTTPGGKMNAYVGNIRAN